MSPERRRTLQKVALACFVGVILLSVIDWAVDGVDALSVVTVVLFTISAAIMAYEIRRPQKS